MGQYTSTPSHADGVVPNASGRITPGNAGHAPAPPPADTSTEASEGERSAAPAGGVERLAEIRALRKSDPARYWSAPIQSEELTLLAGQGGAPAEPEAKAEAEAPAAKPSEEAPGTKDDLADMTAEQIADELADIAKIRRSDRKRYDRELVDRELALIEAQQRGETAGLPGDVLSEWQKTGGVEYRHKLARGAVEKMLASMNEAGGEAAGTEFMESFEALPTSARSAVYRTLALEPGGNARPASASALEQFAGIGDETAALVASWGKDAARRLGAAQSRFATMQAAMAPADGEAAQAWLDGLSPAQQAAVTAALAG